MSRVEDSNSVRCCTVWLCATLATTWTWWCVGSTAAPLMSPEGWVAAFDGLLVRVCAVALLPSTGWLWVVTTWTVADLLRGRRGTAGATRRGATRRLVLLACGAAVVAAAAAPASAGGPGIPDAGPDGHAVVPGHSPLAGLTLPDRAVATIRRSGVVVRHGDSLWSIAESHPLADEPLEERWRAIWAANEHVIGEDPDLILPGQRLALPTTTDHHRRAR